LVLKLSQPIFQFDLLRLLVHHQGFQLLLPSFVLQTGLHFELILERRSHLLFDPSNQTHFDTSSIISASNDLSRHDRQLNS